MIIRIITASTLNNITLSDLQIFEFNNNFNLYKTLTSK